MHIFYKEVTIIPRIIAGKYKRIKLLSPKGLDTRPTIDRTKEALFSILLPYIHDAVVIDLFAGTGQLGLEALSRGASFIYFNDHQKKCRDIINANIDKCHAQKFCKVTSLDFYKAINVIDRQINIVFLDPPYDCGLITSSIEKLHDNGIITIGGLIVCEHSESEKLDEKIGAFTLIDQRKYGIAYISIYKKEE